jgi:hypothetical protein
VFCFKYNKVTHKQRPTPHAIPLIVNTHIPSDAELYAPAREITSELNKKKRAGVNWTCWITVEGKTELQITITVLATHYFLFFTHSLLSISVLALLVAWS